MTTNRSAGDSKSFDDDATEIVEELLPAFLEGIDIADALENLPEESRRMTIECCDGLRVFGVGEGSSLNIAGRTALDAEAFVGTVIGGCRLLRLIGEGGQGLVFEAEEAHPPRTVAVKILGQGILHRSARRRFRQESELLGRLAHGDIVRIFSAGVHQEGRLKLPYLVMEFVRDAKSIVEHAESNVLPRRQIAELFERVASAVQQAHGKGIIHRDLKPSNILVDASGSPKLIDFGVARMLSDVKDRGSEWPLTATGERPGTREYMSPEQSTAPSEADARSDVYALGRVLDRALAASRRRRNETRHANVAGRARATDGELGDIVAKATQTDPADRYQTAAELAADLRRYLDFLPVSARPRGAAYRLVCFARRRTATFLVAAALVVVTLVAGILTLSAWRETATALRAVREANDALRIRAAFAALDGGDWRHAAAELEDAGSLSADAWEIGHARARIERFRACEIARHSGAVEALAFDRDGDRLAIGSDDDGGTVSVFDVKIGRALTTIRPRKSRGDRATYVRDVAFSADESLLVVLGTACVTAFDARRADFAEVWRWDLPSASGANANLRSMAFDAGGGRIFAVSHAGSSDFLHAIETLPLANGNRRVTRTWRFGESGLDITDIAISPDGRHLAASTYAPPFATKIWSIDDLDSQSSDIAPNGTVVHMHQSSSDSVVFLPDGRVASVESSGAVIFSTPFDANSPTRTDIPTALSKIAWVDDGRTLALGGVDRRLWLWSHGANGSDAAPRLASLPLHNREISAIAASSGGLIATGARDGAVCLSPKMHGSRTAVARRSSSIAGVVVTEPNRITVVAADHRGLTLTRIDDGELVAEMSLDGATDNFRLAGTSSTVVYVAHWSSVDTMIAVDLRVERFTCGDPATSRRTGDWTIKDLAIDGNVASFSAAPNGRRLAILTESGRLYAWDVVETDAALHAVAQFEFPGARTCAFLDVGGEQILVAGDALELLEIETGRRRRSNRFDAPATAMSLRRSSREVAIGHADGGLGFARIDDGGRDLVVSKSTERHAVAVAALVHHPHEQRLFSAAKDGRIAVWDTACRSQIVSFRPQHSAIGHLAFDAASENLIAGSMGYFGLENHCLVFGR